MPGMVPARRDELIARLAALDPGKIDLLARMARAMAGQATYLAPTSGSTDLTTEEFVDTFTNFLLLHHGIYDDPLNKEAFEFLFRLASEAAGKTAERNRQRGSATHDVRVNGVRWSLKTEAGKSQSPNIVKIEKWMEARWIRNCHNPASCARSMQYVIDHMSDFERIAVLKATVAKNGSSVLYRVLELPKPKLAGLRSLPHQAFTKEGNKASYGADLLADDGSRILRILLDSSVEKVRIWFSVAHAVNHGSWMVAIPLTAGNRVDDI